MTLSRKQALLLIPALLIPALLVCATPAHAAGPGDGLALSGAIRVRYEALGGQARVGLDDNVEQLSVRTTVLAEWRRDDWQAVVQIDDSRAYLGGPRSGLNSADVNAVEPVQAFVGRRFNDPFGPGTRLDVRAGRLMILLGSRRFITSDDYRNATITYSGVRADAALPGGVGITAFYTFPLIHRPDRIDEVLDNRFVIDRESGGLRLWGGLLTLPAGSAQVEAGFYKFDERDLADIATRDRDLATASLRALRAPRQGALDFNFEGALQRGRASTGTAPGAPRPAVSAFMVHGELGYSFPGAGRVRLSLGGDYVSGDGPGGRYGRFDTLFGMRRADFGPGGLDSAVGRANIVSPVLRFEAAPGTRFDAMASYRPMWLAAREDGFSTTGVRDPAGASGRFAGHQLEGRLRYWLVPAALRAEFNFAYIAKGRFLREAPNAPKTGAMRYGAFSMIANF